jgi:hypothetical protein
LKSINIPSSQPPPTSNSRHANSIENIETTLKSPTNNNTNGHHKNNEVTQNQNLLNGISLQKETTKSPTFGNGNGNGFDFAPDYNNAFKSNVDMNANFADFENNKIYSAAGKL